MYRSYEQHASYALTSYVEHHKDEDGHAIRLNVPVGTEHRAGGDFQYVASVQLCHGQVTETEALDATIQRLEATIIELKQIRRSKEGR